MLSGQLVVNKEPCCDFEHMLVILQALQGFRKRLKIEKNKVYKSFHGLNIRNLQNWNYNNSIETTNKKKRNYDILKNHVPF